MTIFDQLKDILQEKAVHIEDDVEKQKDFVPFMTQRWLSFHSPSLAILLNSSINILWKAFDDKVLLYKLFCGVTPRFARVNNIAYIKKNKERERKEPDMRDEYVAYIANSLQISKREVKEYIESGLVDIKALKKQLEN